MKKKDFFNRIKSWFLGDCELDIELERKTDAALLSDDGYARHRGRDLLSQLLETRQEDGVRELELKAFRRAYAVIAVIICVVFTFILIYAVSFMPRFGEASNPGNNEVADKYLSDTITDTGAVSAVAGMILDYRAFDTLGESFVLFTAVCCVMMLLSMDKEESITEVSYFGGADEILIKLVRILVPVTMLFGIYIIFNGHLSPGGGFAGGAVIGAGMVLWAASLGFEHTSKFFTERLFKSVTSCALLFYCCAKTYSFYTGANEIKSIIPLGTAGTLFSGGLILPLNIAVGMVVACTMYGFFSLFVRGKI